MYSYLKGVITEINANFITVDVKGVGYLVHTPNPYDYQMNEETLVYIYQHVREDMITLFGFQTMNEKNLFIKLLSVKGIGPKSAIAILATGNVDDVIHAIEMGNAKFLNKFPGIGPKASQQIILDLKGKLSFEEDTEIHNSNLDEVSEALEALGYKQKEIKKITKDLDSTLPTNELVKQALSKMLK
jgi:Holliday junction DNA helicase RuvA